MLPDLFIWNNWSQTSGWFCQSGICKGPENPVCLGENPVVEMTANCIHVSAILHITYTLRDGKKPYDLNSLPQ